LKLAADRIGLRIIGSGHECANIGEHVAKGGVENEAVDGLVEGLGEAKRDNDEERAEERKDGIDTLDDTDSLELALREGSGLNHDRSSDEALGGNRDVGPGRNPREGLTEKVEHKYYVWHFRVFARSDAVTV
jgi:hypothetical protein